MNALEDRTYVRKLEFVEVSTTRRKTGRRTPRGPVTAGVRPEVDGSPAGIATATETQRPGALTDDGEGQVDLDAIAPMNPAEPRWSLWGDNPA
jgi:hypothetical protein